MFLKVLAQAVVSKIFPISPTVKLLKLNIKDEISFKPGQWYVVFMFYVHKLKPSLNTIVDNSFIFIDFFHIINLR